MGRAPRLKPERLAEKLVQIRKALGLSQDDLIKHLDIGDLVTQKRISSYETGTNEPPLPILLQYARTANVITDVLIDDELDLPDELPSRTRSDGIRRAPVARRQTKR